ncbi:hypothetical protein [Moorena producens]|uniref:hypothetical protein n=1 Tax=Moorena producens TaxID=1155739 RepID=UPI003C706F0A
MARTTVAHLTPHLPTLATLTTPPTPPSLSLFPVPYSQIRCSLKPETLYLTKLKTAILKILFH